MTSATDFFNTEKYLEYLKKNFEVIGFSDKERDETCTRPDIDIVFKYTEQMGLEKDQSLLEIGCGLGRLLCFLTDKYGISVSGIDRSAPAIVEAKRRLSGRNISLFHSVAESLPFESASFNHVLCWGVFDATEQSQCLSEMLRVLKVGGKLVLTGKNDLYCKDDFDAQIAETKSREQGLPNYFTHFDSLQKFITENGAVIRVQNFFERRGDMMKGKVLFSRPEYFLEYALIIEKLEEKPPHMLTVSDAYSKTWRELNG